MSKTYPLNAAFDNVSLFVSVNQTEKAKNTQIKMPASQENNVANFLINELSAPFIHNMENTIEKTEKIKNMMENIT